MKEVEEYSVVFVSYSWEDDEHKKWVLKLVDRLIEDGIDTYIDQYDLHFGDRLPHFMEKHISNSNYVLIICTPSYKEKADSRKSGVGYEGHIISAELLENNNEKKFIPIIRKGGFRESLPTYLSGKLGIDFSDNSEFENSYEDLLATLLGKKKKPKLGTIPTYIRNFDLKENQSDEKIRILGIVTNEVTVPRMDGTSCSALYKIPFKLSKIPSRLWKESFLRLWDSPPTFTTMHRPGIASVIGDIIILDGTTINEVKTYHRDTLLLCVEQANRNEQLIIKRNNEIETKKQLKIQEHYQNIEDGSNDIEW